MKVFNNTNSVTQFATFFLNMWRQSKIPTAFVVGGSLWSLSDAKPIKIKQVSDAPSAGHITTSRPAGWWHNSWKSVLLLFHSGQLLN